jgi:hypothetical protein
MKLRYDRGAITRRAHALRKERSISFHEAMTLTWAEAKAGAPVVVRGMAKSVVRIDACAQPSGVADALARYGVRIDAIADQSEEFVRRLHDAMLAAAIRRQANVAALHDGARVDHARRSVNGEWRA